MLENEFQLVGIFNSTINFSQKISLGVVKNKNVLGKEN